MMPIRVNLDLGKTASPGQIRFDIVKNYNRSAFCCKKLMARLTRSQIFELKELKKLN